MNKNQSRVSATPLLYVVKPEFYSAKSNMQEIYHRRKNPGKYSENGKQQSDNKEEEIEKIEVNKEKVKIGLQKMLGDKLTEEVEKELMQPLSEWEGLHENQEESNSIETEQEASHQFKK